MASKFYAVRKGRKTGIFDNWDKCKIQVNGYQGAEFSSFKTLKEAEAYLNVYINESIEGIKKEESSCANDIIAYVDGSYDDINNEYSCGVVLFINGEKKVLSRKDNDPELVSMRNVAGEIMGSMIAIKYAIDNRKNNNERLVIYHDYEGISKWCTGEWKTNKIGTKNYKEFYIKASRLIEIKFIKVKAHTGDKYNEEADKLAKRALGIDASYINNEEFNIDINDSSNNISVETIQDSKSNTNDKHKKMKTQIEIKYNNNNISTDDIIKRIKNIWKKQKKGRKVSDIISLDIYINIESLSYEWNLKTTDGSENGEISFEKII